MNAFDISHLPIDETLPVCSGIIPDEWIDESGHAAAANIVLAFEDANKQVLDQLGLDRDYRVKFDTAPFLIEMHVSYLSEMKPAVPYSIKLQFLNFNEKRAHYFLFLHQGRNNQLAATIELLIVNVDLKSRRSKAFPDPILNKFKQIQTAHRNLPLPAQAGNSINL